MKTHSGFTLIEILLYVVIGGITLIVASFSFAQINRISTSFTVNNELNQAGNTVIEQLQNLTNETSTIVSPTKGSSSTSTMVLRKDSVDTTIAQTNGNIVVSYSDGSSTFNINPTGISIATTNNNPTLSFQQVNNDSNNGVSQTIKVKFKLVYNKPTFSTFEYEAEKEFETTITTATKTSIFTPILNTYPTGTNGVAYSLRKLSGLNTNSNNLSSGYNGSAIRVRRDRGLDQNEIDISFTSKGDLDTVALQNFVGYQNFLNYSEDMTNSSGWGLSNVSTITNSTTAPDGTNTAEKINLNAGSAQRFIYKDTNLNNSSTYTDSYYVKANNGYNFVQITPSTGFPFGTAYQNYNLSNGTLAGSSGINAGQANIQSVGNGWYRISLSFTANASGAGRMLLVVVNSSTSARLEAVNVVSATDSVFVWGGMRHLGSSLKPYQQTSINANTGDGYVTTWYDQSGNKNNAIQTSTGSQPKIVDGVNGILTLNSKPVIKFDGTDDQLSTTSFNNTTNSTGFFVASRAANNQSFMSRLTNYATLGSTDLFNIYYLNKSNTAAATGADTKNSLSLNLYTAIRTSSINSTLNIGAGSSGNFLNGNIAELIIYDGNKLANRTDIENNIRDYYGTP